ncbi:hypothetical protein ACFL6I_15545 [candidate division KSB1 bacterium]
MTEKQLDGELLDAYYQFRSPEQKESMERGWGLRNSMSSVFDESETDDESEDTEESETMWTNGHATEDDILVPGYKEDDLNDLSVMEIPDPIDSMPPDVAILLRSMKRSGITNTLAA